MGWEGKLYSLSQVSDHNTSKDCWLIIAGKVYNVTKFLEDILAAMMFRYRLQSLLAKLAGRDATDDFEDVGHSSTARAMLNEFHVGDIDRTSIFSTTKDTPPKQCLYNQDKTPELIIKILQFLVPVFILGVAVGIRVYTKSV